MVKLKKMQYSHEALADVILANPSMKNTDLAIVFDKTPAWVSYVKNSSGFKAYIEKRKTELLDPVLIQQLEEKMTALAEQSIDVLMDKLAGLAPDGDLAAKTLSITSKALGYGVANNQTNIQTNFVVAMPDKVQNPREWADKYKNGGLEAGQRSQNTVIDLPSASDNE